MRIAGTEINLHHKAVEIYLSGCKEPHCKGCHNPELHSFSVGDEVTDEIISNLNSKTNNPLIDYFWVLGGEPLDQDINQLENLLSKLIKPVVLFTKYEIIPFRLKPYLYYIKTGRYIQNSTSYTEPLLNITLASLNQKVIKLVGC